MKCSFLMGVSSLEPGREKDLSHHLSAAGAIDPLRRERIERLGEQLDPLAVVPLLGAGASYDCGMRLAHELGDDLYHRYRANFPTARVPEESTRWRTDLGRVADAICLAGGTEAAVAELGLDDPALWPAQRAIRSHFCGYRILARMAREEMLEEAITFNYDCGFEHGLYREGFQLGSAAAGGRRWLDHATVVADHATHCEPRRRGAFVLSKVHGCAARYRRTMGSDPKAREAIVLRWSKLLDWRTDFWARDVLADRARRNVLLLIGFSGQDPVIHAALTQVLGELDAFESPRIVVIDTKPQTLPLELLVEAGGGNDECGPEAITRIAVPGEEGITPTLIVLFAAMLARRIEPMLTRLGAKLPPGPKERLASLLVSTPAALRGSYLVRRSDPQREGAQRINLEQAAKNGYVPHTADPHTAAHSMRMRETLRRIAGGHPHESIEEALADQGFVPAAPYGKAFLPVGLLDSEIDLSGLRRLGRAHFPLEVPPGLEPVVVGHDAGGSPSGFALFSGHKVSVP